MKRRGTVAGGYSHNGNRTASALGLTGINFKRERKNDGKMTRRCSLVSKPSKTRNPRDKMGIDEEATSLHKFDGGGSPLGGAAAAVDWSAPRAAKITEFCFARLSSLRAQTFVFIPEPQSRQEPWEDIHLLNSRRLLTRPPKGIQIPPQDILILPKRPRSTGLIPNF